MTEAPAYMIPLDSITVPDRQRKKIDGKKLDELVHSIWTKGLIHAITVNVRTDKDEVDYELVAGERRLRAFERMQKMYVGGSAWPYYNDQPIPEGMIPAQVRYDMTDEELIEVELDENIMRVDISWQEQTEAVAKLHRLRKTQNPDQTIEDTAQEVREKRGGEGPATSNDRTFTRQAEVLVDFMDIEGVANAPNQKAAFKALQEHMAREMNEATVLTPELTDDPEDPDAIMRKRQVLYHKSMEDAEDYIPAGAFDLCIMDPPYGLGVADFGGAQADKHRYSEVDAFEVNMKAIDVASELCKKDAHMYIFCDLDMFPSIKNYAEEKGWNVRRTPLIWDKGPRGHLADGGVLGYRRAYEFILFATRGGRTCNALLSDVIRVVDHSERWHAAQKPVELYKTLMEQSAQIGNKVLDLFAGSGVVFAAAMEANMYATGFEIDPVAIAQIEANLNIWRKTDV